MLLVKFGQYRSFTPSGWRINIRVDAWERWSQIFKDLAIRCSNLLYNYIDSGCDGFYRTFVTDFKFRSRMQAVFTIKTGEGEDEQLVEKFLKETSDLGWLDIRSHPLGISSSAIRVTMYNPQPVEVIEQVLEFMKKFKSANA